MPNITLPKNITFKRWASQLKTDLPNVLVPRPPNIEGWRGWASQLVGSTNLHNVPLPTHHRYPQDEDWKEWASQFTYSMSIQ